MRRGVSPDCVRLLVGSWVLLSIDHRVLLAVEGCFSQLWRFLWGLVFEVFSLYTTVMAYLSHQGGPLSSSFIELTQRILSLFSAGTMLLLPIRFVFSPFLQEGSLEEDIRSLRHRVQRSLCLLIGGFTAALFVVTKVSDGWGPIIVLSTLISSVVVSEFRTPRLPEMGPPEAASCSQNPSAIVLAASSCMETFKQFAFVFLAVWACGVDPSSLVL